MTENLKFILVEGRFLPLSPSKKKSFLIALCWIEHMFSVVSEFFQILGGTLNVLYDNSNNCIPQIKVHSYLLQKKKFTFPLAFVLFFFPKKWFYNIVFFTCFKMEAKYSQAILEYIDQNREILSVWVKKLIGKTVWIIMILTNI